MGVVHWICTSSIDKCYAFIEFVHLGGTIVHSHHLVVLAQPGSSCMSGGVEHGYCSLDLPALITRNTFKLYV